MRIPLRSRAFALIGIALVLASCDDDPTGLEVPRDGEEGVLAAATPVDAIAAFLELDVNDREPVSAAADMFLKIDGIEGEAMDQDHEGEVDVLGVEWSTSVLVEGGAAGGNGRTNIDSIRVTKEIDKATPLLMQAAETGSPITEVRLALRKPGGTTGSGYLTVTLEDVVITSAVPDGTGASATTEEVSFSFQRVVWAVPGQEPSAATAKSMTPVDAVARFLDLDINRRQPTAAAVDMYLKLTDIPGDASADGHEEEIDILSFRWGTSLRLEAGGGGSGWIGNDDIVLGKSVDKATPKLAESIRAEDTIPDGVLAIRRTTGDGEAEYLTLALEDVTIVSADPHETREEAEEVTITVDRIDW